MTMSWMETIRFIGFDLQVATVLAVGIITVVAHVLKSAWGRASSGATLRGSTARSKARRSTRSLRERLKISAAQIKREAAGHPLV